MMSVLQHASACVASSARSISSPPMRGRSVAIYSFRNGLFVSVVSLLSAAFGVAAAWIALPPQKQRRMDISILWSDFRKVSKCDDLPNTNRTWCDPPSVMSTGNVASASKAIKPPFLLTEHTQYELMTIPDRGKLETHAIYGSLLKSNCIERYDVYRTLRSARVRGTVNADNETMPDVVGVVTVGENLDGHSGIVHGGIIALIIDDVLGFGYYAVLIDELESLESNNHGAVDDYLDVVAVTANLNINFRAPLPSGSTFMVEAKLVSDGSESERRTNKNKFHWEVQVMSLDRSRIFCQATSLYVVPKQASRGER